VDACGSRPTVPTNPTDPTDCTSLVDACGSGGAAEVSVHETCGRVRRPWVGVLRREGPAFWKRQIPPDPDAPSQFSGVEPRGSPEDSSQSFGADPRGPPKSPKS